MNEDERYHYAATEAMNREQVERQVNPYAPQLLKESQENQAVLVGQVDPKKVIRDIMLMIRGQDIDEETGEIIQVSRPKMNELGREAVWYWLKSHINQNITLSSFNETEVRHFMDILQDDFVDELALNWKVYGIVNKTDLDAINNSVLGNIKACLNRALNHNEKSWIGKISVENISGGSRLPQPKKESFFSKLRL